MLVGRPYVARYGDVRTDCEHVFNWSVMPDMHMTSRMWQIAQDEQHRLDDVLKKQVEPTLFTRDTVRLRGASDGAEQMRDSSVLWQIGTQSFRVCYEDVTHVQPLMERGIRESCFKRSGHSVDAGHGYLVSWLCVRMKASVRFFNDLERAPRRSELLPQFLWKKNNFSTWLGCETGFSGPLAKAGFFEPVKQTRSWRLGPRDDRTWGRNGSQSSLDQQTQREEVGRKRPNWRDKEERVCICRSKRESEMTRQKR